MSRFHNHVALLALAVALEAGPAYAQTTTSGQTATTAEDLPPQAQPDAQPAPGDGEVVVTAQKNGVQSLQRTPLAIQAFSGADLKERNVKSIDDLVSAVPGALEGQRQSVASRSYNLRGAGGSNANGDSPIGYYLDDVPFVVTNFGIAPPVRFLDIDRVEVLRGPQGTLYGQGSSGGVFIFHTRDPNLDKVQFIGELEGSQTRGAGGLNYGVSGAVSIPIIKDMLAVRVSGGHSYNPGWADEYFGPYDGTPDRRHVNVVRNDDIRAVVLFKPADNVKIRGQYWHFRPRQQYLGGMQSVDPANYQNTAGQPFFGNGDFKLYSLTASVDFKDFSVTSATSDLKGNFGINRPLYPSGFFSSQFYPKMFSQEVRANSTGVGPLHWLLGGAYENGSGPQKNHLFSPTQDINADNNTITHNWATFGELSYDLLDGKVVPLVGLRYFHDRRAFANATTTNWNTTNVVTWRANLSFLPTDSLTVFVTASTGFRAGIVQSEVQADLLQQSGIPAGTQLKPEKSTNYETGIKWRTPDHNLSIGLNGYITKYHDLQTSTPTIDTSVSGFSNFGEATSKGIDVEVHWRTPLKGLSLNAVGNFNDSKFDKVVPAIQKALPYLRPGTRIVNTIPHNWRLDASYVGTISGDWEGFGNFAWSRSGDRLQTSGVYALPYSLLSATLGVRKGPYELALIADNLSDERGPTIRGTQGPLSGSGPNPRTIGLRFRANFQ